MPAKEKFDQMEAGILRESNAAGSGSGPSARAEWREVGEPVAGAPRLWAIADVSNRPDATPALFHAIAEPALTRLEGSGGLAFGLTLVLGRQPSPAEDSLAPLVTGASLSMGVGVAPDPERLVAASSAGVEIARLFPRATHFDLCQAEQVLASAGVSGGAGALSASLDRDQALAVLAALRGEPSGLLLRADVSFRAVFEAAEPRRATVQLDQVFEHLAGLVPEDRVIRLEDLERQLAELVEGGAILVTPVTSPAGDAVAGCLPDLLRACRPILARVESDDVGDPAAYRLTEQPPFPGSQLTLQTSAGPVALERSVQVTRPLEEVCREVLAEQSLDSVVRAVCPSPMGDGYEPVARRLPAARGAAPGSGTSSPPLASFGASAAAMPAVLKATRAPASAAALAASDLVVRPPGRLSHTFAVNDLVVNGLSGPERLQHLPIVSGEGPLWRDRIDSSRRWYAPQLAWVAPTSSDVPATSPFLFSFQVVGHDAQGRPGLEATLRLTLEPVAPSEAGRSAKAVAQRGLSASLEIPYRDERGVTRARAVAATSIAPDGERHVATFRLTDTWARLCYGALAIPGFQTEPVRVVVRYVFPAYVPLPKDTRISYGGKVAQVAGLEVVRGSDAAAARAGPVLLTHSVASHALVAHPAVASVAVHPQIVAPHPAVVLQPTRYGIRTQGRSFRLDLSVPCQQYGSLYRQTGEDGEVAIGCRDAYTLGQTQLRLYEPVPVDLGATRLGARVFRSLQVPGRFLVLPQAYTIARFEAGDSRAYRPAIFLFSNIDAVHPESSRCVAMATLQPDIQPYVRARLEEYLRANVHPNPMLEWPTELGVTPTYQWALAGGPNAIEPAAAQTPEGFQVSLAAGIQAALQLKAIFEHGGVNASVQFALDDGTVLASTLTVDLARVNGPWSTGPVSVELSGATATLTNHIEQAVDAGDLLLLGGEAPALVPVEQRIAPEEAVRVAASGMPTSGLAQYAYAGGVASLAEVRTFIEDIYVEVVYVASIDFAALGLSEVSVEGRIPAVSGSVTATLRPGAPSTTASFVLPLTTYLGQPMLQFRVTRTRADGSVATGPWHDWSLASQGSVIEINPDLVQEG